MEVQKIKLFEESHQMGIFVVGNRRPNIFNAFLNLAHEVMHPESAFDALTRELLGAYVSKKFGCSFCHLGHLETAYAIGGDSIRSLVDEPSEELKEIFKVADLVVDNKITESIVSEFLAKGYTEKHYEDIVFVCALFGFANRMVTGFGVEYLPQRDEASSRFLARGYKMK